MRPLHRLRRSTDTVCCGPTDLDHAMILYTEGQLSGLPMESVPPPLVRNPHSPRWLKTGEHVLDLGSGGGIDCFLAHSR
ncbi:MAG: hypothetical protein CM1200mP27_07280 [Chloroflexota bacterium]|nr:MAG: hypothetical protein CM1200mP27_07280 [Chloroflexota bacterium]